MKTLLLIALTAAGVAAISTLASMNNACKHAAHSWCAASQHTELPNRTG